MPDGTYNTVVASDIDVRVHLIDGSIRERQSKDVVIKVEAIGFPDRLASSQQRGTDIRTTLECLFGGSLAGSIDDITFGVWLDLKPDATWSE